MPFEVYNANEKSEPPYRFKLKQYADCLSIWIVDLSGNDIAEVGDITESGFTPMKNCKIDLERYGIKCPFSTTELGAIKVWEPTP